MDYQKLAKTLLRVLSVWLIVQSIPQLAGALYSLSALPHRPPGVSNGLFWLSPVMGGVTVAVGVCLYLLSDRLSTAITRDL